MREVVTGAASQDRHGERELVRGATSRTGVHGFLAALLWGDVPDSQARASLRQTLSLLGKALDGAPTPCLATEARTIALVPAAVAVDVSGFEAAATERTPEGPERQRLRELAVDALTRLLARSLILRRSCARTRSAMALRREGYLRCRHREVRPQ